MSSSSFFDYTRDLNSGWAQDAGKYYRDTQKQDSFQPSKSSDYTNDVDKWKKFGNAFRMAGDIWNNRDGGYGGGYNRPISSIGGGGIQQSGDLTFVYPQQFSPFTIEGTRGSSSGMGGALGTALGAAAAMIPGMGPGIAAALPAIGGGVGSFFG